MSVSCAWCGRAIHERIGDHAGVESHGICWRCLEVRLSRPAPWWAGLAYAFGVAGGFVVVVLVIRAGMALARSW